MLSEIKKRLDAANLKMLDVGSVGAAKAAVLLALTDEATPSIILTKRAEHLNSHRGEVALPGGKWEPGDKSLLETALRESWEEVGLEPAQVDVLSILPTFSTRPGVLVSPFVGIVSADVELFANPEELDAVFRVPIDYFCEANRLRTDVYVRDGVTYWTPAYLFEEYEIWGFTARVVTAFLSEYAGLSVPFESAAPLVNHGKFTLADAPAGIVDDE